jgi:hypothetical protein
MLIPHVVQTEADKVFVNIYNSQDSSVTDGDLVCWDTTSPDGVKTTQPTTQTFSIFCGVVDGTVAAAAYGLAQAYGYKAAVMITGVQANDTSAGDILVPVTATDYAQWQSSGEVAGGGFVMAAEAVTSSTTVTTYKAFIRAL